MEFCVYILQSKSTARYYCGSTSDITRRIRQHNDPDYQVTKTTKRFKGPWSLIWSEPCSNRSAVMKREVQIKKRGIRRFLQGLN